MNEEIMEFAYDLLGELVEKGYSIINVVINSNLISIEYVANGITTECKINPKDLGLN